jgi:SAM-dependent methyltransferase
VPRATLSGIARVRAGTPDHRSRTKTRDRVRELAEISTHEREVKAILDLIPDMFRSGAEGADIKFLEPACGSGNFLEEILRRKLEHIRFSSTRSGDVYEHRILQAVASVYGVDISPANVSEARDRMMAGVHAHYFNDANTIDPTVGFESALRAILGTNIIGADFLADASTIEVVDYQAVRGGYFNRAWSMLADPWTAETQRTRLHPKLEPKRDAVPVHYADLAAMPSPAMAAPPSSNVSRSACTASRIWRQYVPDILG